MSGAENPSAYTLVRQALADGWAACAADGAPPERAFAQGTSAILYTVPAVRGQALPGVLKIPVYHRRPPEWYPGRERFDRRLDYFAVGGTAFFELTGRRPYDNRETDPGQVMATYAAQYAQALPRLSQAAQRVGLAGATVEFLAACLPPEVEERPREFPCEDGC